VNNNRNRETRRNREPGSCTEASHGDPSKSRRLPIPGGADVPAFDREVIDKYHSRLDLAGHATSPGEVTAPNRSAKTEVSDIGEVNRDAMDSIFAKYTELKA
jgi:hypothetical protein